MCVFFSVEMIDKIDCYNTGSVKMCSSNDPWEFSERCVRIKASFSRPRTLWNISELRKGCKNTVLWHGYGRCWTFRAIYLYVWLVSTFIPSLSLKLSNQLCAKILNFYEQHENRKNVHILSSRIFQSEWRCKMPRFLINLNPDS